MRNDIENSESAFDRVLHSVGDDGKFQKRFNVIFNFLLAALTTMVYMNLIMALTIPDHWCYVPGREKENKTTQEWNDITLPREIDSSAELSRSSCKMFNSTYDAESGIFSKTNETMTCQYGYEYDTEWYSSTIPTTKNWVCDKELYVSNVLAACKIGEVFGGLVFGYLGDIIGRRPVFILATGISMICRLVSVMVIDYYMLFLIASVLASIPGMTAPQACQVILMETSPMEDRAFIAQYQNFGWTIGLSALPLIYWISRDWTYYLIFSSAPLMLYIPLGFFMIESPRWLLSRGRVAECIQQLKKISKINKTKLPPNALINLNNVTIKPEKIYGIYSLFANWRLAKNTTLLVLSWVATLLSYNTIVYNVSTLSGNPFLNFFLQSIAELPSYMLGKILCERIGRRFSGALAFFVGVCSLASIMLIANDPGLGWLQITLVVIAKFAISMCYFVVALQSLEVYPTSVRQTGFTFGLITGNIMSCFVPYIVYLGLNYNVRFPYLVITLLCLIGFGGQLLLPETLHQKLPETLHETKTFGMNQEFWTIPKKRQDSYMLANLKQSTKYGRETSEIEM